MTPLKLYNEVSTALSLKNKPPAVLVSPLPPPKACTSWAPVPLEHRTNAMLARLLPFPGCALSGRAGCYGLPLW